MNPGSTCLGSSCVCINFARKGELLLTIMSSLAQEESRSISENCTWGQRKRFTDGKVTVPFARFLGYDRGEDGNLVVNPEQAVTVKRIYSLFLQGKTPHGICQILMDDGIPSPSGKKKWNQSTVKSILMKPSIFDLLQAHPFTPCFSGGGEKGVKPSEGVKKAPPRRRDAPLYSLFKVLSTLPKYHHQDRLTVSRSVVDRKPHCS